MLNASDRFNEAGARTPRKAEPDRLGVREREHVGHASMRPGRERPGKEGKSWPRSWSGWLASMRPGRERPERSRTFGARCRRASSFNEAGARTPGKERVEREQNELRGHLSRFNEAGARTPRKAVCVAVRAGAGLASMRPGRERPGKDSARPVQQAAELTASMRPGRERPGKPSISAVKAWWGLEASMRPGRERPGKFATSQEQASFIALLQ